MEEIKERKLKKIVCIRITEDDYQKLNGITNNQKKDVSKLLRTLIRAALAMVKENNSKK